RFSSAFSGNPGTSHTNKVTAKFHVDENSPAAHPAQPSFPALRSSDLVKVTKSASPSSLSEPGGAVTFTVKVTNASVASTDPLTLSSLVDDIYGDLNGQGTCATPQTILYGASYSCSFTKTVSGNAGFSQ